MSTNFNRVKNVDIFTVKIGEEIDNYVPNHTDVRSDLKFTPVYRLENFYNVFHDDAKGFTEKLCTLIAHNSRKHTTFSERSIVQL